MWIIMNGFFVYLITLEELAYKYWFVAVPIVCFDILGILMIYTAVAKDANIETVYIYFDYPCDYLETKIQEFMQSNKVKIVYGNKQNFLATHTCDCYFLEDIDDICYISRRHQQRSEVIVPMFSFNVSCYDFVEGGNVELTKDGFFKDINLERTPIEYLSEYNLDIALIDIPL